MTHEAGDARKLLQELVTAHNRYRDADADGGSDWRQVWYDLMQAVDIRAALAAPQAKEGTK